MCILCTDTGSNMGGFIVSPVLGAGSCMAQVAKNPANWHEVR